MQKNKKILNEKEKRRFWKQSKLYVSGAGDSLADEWVGGSLPSSDHSALINLAKV